MGGAHPAGTSGLWGLSTLLITSVPAYFITQYQYKIFEKRLDVSDRKTKLMQEAIQAIGMIKMMAAERWWYRRIKTVRDEEFRRLVQARLLGFVSGMLYTAAPTIILVVAFTHYTLIAEKTLTATIAFVSDSRLCPMSFRLISRPPWPSLRSSAPPF
jgi:ABC-type bacteriocin/lantibiotic exporter with double-glycine peptidase domain